MPIVAPSTGSGGTTALTIAEVDGAPSVSANALIVSNGSLTDSGGGTATVVTGAGTTSVAFHGARVTSGTAQSIGTSAWTSLLFDTETYDTDAYHAAGSARMTIPAGQAGYYVIGASIQWAASSTADRAIRLYYSGATVIAQAMQHPNQTASIPTRMEAITTYYMPEAAYVEAQVWQNSGGNINSESSGVASPQLWVTKVGT